MTTSRVGIIGVGMTPFVRRSEERAAALGRRAVVEAVRDAGIEPSAIGAAFVGAGYGSAGLGQRILKDLGCTGIPITNLENACASGAEALHHAVRAVECGVCDVALAIGVETPSQSLGTGMIPLDPDEALLDQMGMSFPVLYALRASAHMAAYGTTPEQLAAVSVKNRRNGVHNPVAVFREEVTLDEVLASPMIADPITRLMSCPGADGAAAVVVAANSVARPLARVAGGWFTSGRLVDVTENTDTLSSRTAATAYERASIDPADIDLVEVHDAFTIGELMAIEALGIVPPGGSGPYVEEGKASIGGGGVAVNPSGGLIARGHPMGATGIAQVVEVTCQIAGRAGARQLDRARVGVCHTRGGGIFDLEANACAVTVLTAP